MEYIGCINCLTSYEEVQDFCCVCLAKKGSVDGAMAVFDKKTISEMSKLGGPIDEIISVENGGGSKYLIPCEWGAVMYDGKTGFSWEFLAGLVSEVKVSNDLVRIKCGRTVYVIDLISGELIRQE